VINTHDELLKELVDGFSKRLADNLAGSVLAMAREIAQAKESTEFLTMKEMQEFLSISPSKAQEMTNLKGFPVYRVGKLLRINKAELIDWIRQNGASE